MAETPITRLLVVGIDDYQNAPNLRGAVGDAGRWRQRAIDAGIAPDNIRVVPNPNRAAFLAELNTFAQQLRDSHADAEHCGLFVFAGRADSANALCMADYATLGDGITEPDFIAAFQPSADQFPGVIGVLDCSDVGGTVAADTHVRSLSLVEGGLQAAPWRYRWLNGTTSYLGARPGHRAVERELAGEWHGLLSLEIMGFLFSYDADGLRAVPAAPDPHAQLSPATNGFSFFHIKVPGNPSDVGVVFAASPNPQSNEIGPNTALWKWTGQRLPDRFKLEYDAHPPAVPGGTESYGESGFPFIAAQPPGNKSQYTVHQITSQGFGGPLLGHLFNRENPLGTFHQFWTAQTTALDGDRRFANRLDGLFFEKVTLPFPTDPECVISRA